MAKEKATIVLDRDKAALARSLLGARSTSEAVDRALDEVIRRERLRADVAAYRRLPPTEHEAALALAGDLEGLADDTDWEALYGIEDE